MAPGQLVVAEQRRIAAGQSLGGDGQRAVRRAAGEQGEPVARSGGCRGPARRRQTRTAEPGRPAECARRVADPLSRHRGRVPALGRRGPFGDPQYGVAQAAPGRPGERDDAGHVAGDLDDLACRGEAFGLVGVQDRLVQRAAEDAGQLPGEVPDILEAQVQPLAADGRVGVGRVPDQQDPPARPHARGDAFGGAEGGERLDVVHPQPSGATGVEDVLDEPRGGFLPLDRAPGDPVAALRQGRDDHAAARGEEVGRHVGYADSGQRPLGEDERGGQCAAGESDTEQFTHRVLCTPSAPMSQRVRSRSCRPAPSRTTTSTVSSPLGEGDQPAVPFHGAAGPPDGGFQERVGTGLGQYQRCLPGVQPDADEPSGVAVVVEPTWGVRLTACRVQHVQVVQCRLGRRPEHDRARLPWAGSGNASKIRTRAPRRRSWPAVASPHGPAPITTACVCVSMWILFRSVPRGVVAGERGRRGVLFALRALRVREQTQQVCGEGLDRGVGSTSRWPGTPVRCRGRSGCGAGVRGGSPGRVRPARCGGRTRRGPGGTSRPGGR